MPIMIVGADSPGGIEIVARVAAPGREVRCFVTDPLSAATFKAAGAKVAAGDVTDVGHIAAACHDCFSVVFMRAAAIDGRERAFAATADAVFEGWQEAVEESRPRRVIWVGMEPPGQAPAGIDVRAVATWDSLDVLASRVAAIDDEPG